MTEVNKQISTGTDDCEEEGNSSIDLSSDKPTVGYWYNIYDIGLRWQSVNIPQGATITSAILRVYNDTSAGTLSANIRGIDEDNTATWSSGSRPSQRTKTTATITANQANWTNWGTDNWMTINITSVIQEIVNRGSWASNNALAIVIEDAAGSGTNYLRIRSYDYLAPFSAKLDVVYEDAGVAIPVFIHHMRQQRIL